MDTKTVGAISATVVVGFVIGLAATADLGKTTSVVDAQDAGQLAGARVYRVSKLDGGSTMVAVEASTDGGLEVDVVLDHSPCAQRPVGVSALLCSLRDGGDRGDGNVMQDGEWAGAGCVETPCTVMFGDPSP